MENSIISRSNTQACAACKYQRRKCSPNCILAPYFPPDRHKQFLNAHRLFGVGRITNMIKHRDPLQRDIAMSTIIYESDIRARDPVGGCYRLLQQLQSQIENKEAERDLVNQQLASYRAQSHSSHTINATPQPYIEHIPDEHFLSYGPLQKDINTWSMHNSLHESPLQLEDLDQQEPIIDFGYDEKPVLDLMENMNLDALS